MLPIIIPILPPRISADALPLSRTASIRTLAPSPTDFGSKITSTLTKKNYASQGRRGLVLQLSLLVDQEFGGLSFPVAGFGFGLMDPTPERPCENEVDTELSWKRVMRRRISGMLKAIGTNALDLPPPFGRRVRPASPPGRRAPASIR